MKERNWWKLDTAHLQMLCLPHVQSLQPLGWYFNRISVCPFSWKPQEWFTALALTAEATAQGVNADQERLLRAPWHTCYRAPTLLSQPGQRPFLCQLCLPLGQLSLRGVFRRRCGRRGRCCCVFSAKHLAVIGWGDVDTLPMYAGNCILCSL